MKKTLNRLLQKDSFPMASSLTSSSPAPPINYPVVVRIKSRTLVKELVVSSPDFQIFKSCLLDEIQSSQQIGKMVLDLIQEISQAAERLRAQGKPIPSPTPHPELSQIAPARTSELLSTMQVASILGVSQETVRRMCRAQLLTPLLSPKGHRKFKPEEIRSYLEKTDPQRLRQDLDPSPSDELP